MKLPIVPLSLALALGVSAFAQQGSADRKSKPGSGTGGNVSQAASSTAGSSSAQPAGASAPEAPTPSGGDQKVFKAGAELPAPSDPSEIGSPTVALPTEPIEPYLLTRDAGPFMVMAHTFRGPDAARYALALVLELRRDFGVPAWIFYQKVQPMHSLVRNVPPTAPTYQRAAELTMPEKVRVYDEAAVLVGNCRTLKESQELLNRVKAMHPKCIDGMPSIWPWRKGQGLSRAMRCTNPYVPAQYLYPSKNDPLIKQMNAGPHSVFNCPSRYTLQIAEFTGKSTLEANGDKKLNIRENPSALERMLQQSPLAHAADDAEKLADALAKADDIRRTGYQPYVYHDRFSSKVTIGAFDSPSDPAATALRQKLLDLAVDFNNRKITDVMIVPAPALMDLKELPPH
jgi:hypothetical protein